MKLDENKQIVPELEVVQEIKKTIEYKKLDEFTPKIDGGKIFRQNLETLEVQEVEYQTSPDYVLGSSNNPKLHLEPGCAYVEAINIKNAKKKFAKKAYAFVA